MTRGRNSCFIYLIGDDGAILVYMENGVVQRRLFAATPDRQHTKTFIDLMNDYPYAPIYMLVDILDQSYVKHALPPVTSLGLNKLVSRRLDRDFAKEDIKGALNLGREKKGRKDWNFLLISISSASGIQGWLDLVLDLPNKFGGIFLLPVECENFLRKLSEKAYNPANISMEPVDPDAPKRRISLPSAKKKTVAAKETGGENPRWQLLVSHHKVGGFRQVVLKDGRLIFTRITQESEGGTPAITAGNVEQEVLNTIEYLKRLSLTESSSLDLFFIVSQEIKANLSRDRMPCNQAYIFTPHEAAELCDLKQAVLSADRYGDMVIASAFGATKKRRLKMNPTYADKLDKLYAGIMALRGAAALSALVAIFFILSGVFSIPSHLLKMQELKDQEKDKQARFSELSGIDSGVTASADQIKDLVELHEFLSKEEYDVIKTIAETAGIVSGDRTLDRWEWKASNLIQQEDKPVEITINFDTELTYSSNLAKVVNKEKQDFFDLVAQFFPDYEISKEGGEAGQKTSLQFSLEDTAEVKKNAKKSEVIKVSLKGPKPADPAAADGTLAPVGM